MSNDEVFTGLGSELGLTADQVEAEIYSHIIGRNPEHDFEPTLDRVREACDLLGSPQHAYKVIHVTGTNGKTSTARMAESLVRAHGLRTGLFTSPHLTTVRERIQIDGVPIPKQAFIDLWQDVAPIIHMVDTASQAKGGPRMSFFEVLTVLAFAAFADAPVDVAVIEVGMGGSWDATNLADGEVAIIAPVDVDHQQWLGDDVVGIAEEKAGIIKPGATVVVSEQRESVDPVIAAAAKAAGARLIREGESMNVAERRPGVGGQLITLTTPAATYTEIFLPLYGDYQAHNALLALTAVEALMAGGEERGSLEGEIVEEGFAQVTSPGRLEVVRSSPMIIVDAAHNPHGIDALVEAIDENFVFEKLVGVVGVLADKDSEGILAGLEPMLDEIVITPLTSPRAIDPDVLAAQARELFGDGRVHEASDLPDAIDRAVKLAEEKSDMGGGVLIVGSITLIADARTMLGADKRKGAGRAR